MRAVATLLRNMPAGLIPAAKAAEILKVLEECWDDFEGSADTKMQFWKIVRDGVPEDFAWKPPILSFTIERHGSLVLGSSRAEKQRWSLNIAEGTARHDVTGFRQMEPRALALDVKAIATKVCEEVQKGPAINSELTTQGILIWKGDDEIIIKHGKLIPNDGFKQTISGRRRRFRADLKNKMALIGWELIDEGRVLIYRRK